jgi:putative hydrolase of the HAD superfamily
MTNITVHETLFQWLGGTGLTIIVDGDDTLWYDSRYFVGLRERFLALSTLGEISVTAAEAKLNTLRASQAGETGYVERLIVIAMSLGFPDFAMKHLRSACQEFLRHEVQVLPHVRSALVNLRTHRRVLLTKGAKDEQFRKLSMSGLADLFDSTLVLGRKDTATYRACYEAENIIARDVVMVGNSLQHDIIPVIESGGKAVWLNHDENINGRNSVKPTTAVEISSWKEISDLDFLTPRADTGSNPSGP